MKDNDKLPRIIDTDELKKYSESHHLTVGQLKEFLLKNPEITDDSIISIQRVEDIYYEEHNWGVILKKGHHYNSFLDTNMKMSEEIDRRNAGESPEYQMPDPSKYIMELSDSDMEQYTPAWCCVKYHDDNKLYIDLHY